MEYYVQHPQKIREHGKINKEIAAKEGFAAKAVLLNIIFEDVLPRGYHLK